MAPFEWQLCTWCRLCLIYQSESTCCPIVLVCLLVYGQSSGEEPLLIIAGSQVSVPLISRPVICYRKGGTTPPKLWSLASLLQKLGFLFCFLAMSDRCTIVYSLRAVGLYCLYTLCTIRTHKQHTLNSWCVVVMHYAAVIYMCMPTCGRVYTCTCDSHAGIKIVLCV